MSEQRRAERFTINEEFNALGDEGSVSYVSDLSTKGVFVHTRHRIAVGELLDLRFTLVLDDPVIIEGRGRVVRQAKEGLGVEFTDLRPDMVLRIHDAVARQRAAAQDGGDLAASSLAARSVEQASFEDAKTGVYRATQLDPSDLELIDEEMGHELEAGESGVEELDLHELDAGELDAGELDAGELDAQELKTDEPSAKA